MKYRSVVLRVPDAADMGRPKGAGEVDRQGFEARATGKCVYTAALDSNGFGLILVGPALETADDRIRRMAVNAGISFPQLVALFGLMCGGARVMGVGDMPQPRQEKDENEDGEDWKRGEK